eukprot:TRINITY_DN64029_c0_g1_i1.p1 TRINITY_DN64029_c0_g1~~TRINITY_DN64029_c0_g1_i1.p1  ORF type:complete len:601 (-),score=141.90 TRINITY_DN64029_c0_g1_i1:114-1916(-)
MGTRYRRVRVVGKGSFGCCWLVESELGEQCILKQIDVSKMPAKQKEEATNEVKVLSKLRHPFIINYRESYVDSGLLCIITDYAERGDLYRTISQQKRLGRLLLESLVLRWFTQISLALKHMHDRRILHRDLKTQNIFLSGPGEGSVKVGGFGIARVLQHTQDCARTAIGTPFYLSPEICQEKPYSFKSDVWSLGCVLYELATLHHAFDADSMQGLVLKILRGVPPEVPSLFSQEFKALIKEMLQKNPSNRPTIDEVLQRPTVRSVIRQLLAELEHRQQHRGEQEQVQQPLQPRKSAESRAEDVQQPAHQASPRQRKLPQQPSQRERMQQLKEEQRERLMLLQRREGGSKGLRDSVRHQQRSSTSAPKQRQTGALASESPRSGRSGSSASPSAARRAREGQPTQQQLRQQADHAAAEAKQGLKPKGSSQAETRSQQRESQPLDVTTRPAGQKEDGQENGEKAAQSESQEHQVLITTLEEGLGLKAQVAGSLQAHEGEGATAPEDEGLRRPRFLRPDGGEIELPVGAEDSLSYRIEALRVYIEKEVGLDDFMLVYRHLSTSSGGERAEVIAGGLHSKVSAKAVSFLPLVTQLIVCEDECFQQ